MTNTRVLQINVTYVCTTYIYQLCTPNMSHMRVLQIYATHVCTTNICQLCTANICQMCVCATNICPNVYCNMCGAFEKAFVLGRVEKAMCVYIHIYL